MLRRHLIYLFVMLAVVFSGCFLELAAQKTTVIGTVIDAKTQEPLMFVNLQFLGTDDGTSTDERGKFVLETHKKTDTLLVSFVGYLQQKIPLKQGVVQKLNIELVPSEEQLEEVLIEAGIDPAMFVWKKTIERKHINNPEKIDYLEYDVYNKFQFDLNNIGENFKKSKLFKKFDFVMENIDTVDGKPFLPILLSETKSTYYWREKPQKYKEIIKGNQISGIENQSVTQFMGEMYFSVNIYNNFVPMFDKNFISPISDRGDNFYDFYMLDTLDVDGIYCYKIRFVPKRIGELTFTGNLWITADSTYAVKQTEGEISEWANVNFLNKMMFKQNFQQVSDTLYLLQKEQVFADFYLTEKTIGVFGRKTSVRNNFKVNEPQPDEFYNDPTSVVVDSASLKNNDKEFWDNERLDTLNPQEKGIYSMMDTLEENKMYNFYKDLGYMGYTGYFPLGPLEVGNLYSMYAFNAVENNRFALSLRTSNDFSKRIEFHGFAAYGTADEKFKYGLGTRWKAFVKKRGMFYLDYYKDYEQLGRSPDVKSTSTFGNSVLARNLIDRLTFVEKFVFRYEQDWFNGFMTTAFANWRRFTPINPEAYQRETSSGQLEYIPQITTAETGLSIRYSKDERYVAGEFDRQSLGSRFPILTLDYAKGFQGIFGSQFDYHRLAFNIEHKPKLGIFGKLRYNVFAGKYWGGLPYPFLYVHPGNETYYWQTRAFNLMNFFEFISDSYTGFFLEHFFDGFIMDHIPMIKHTGWRSVFTARALIGTISEIHKEKMILPTFSKTFNGEPYVEVGFGIHNILKFVRIDCVWRVTQKEPYAPNNFGVFGKFQFSF